MRNPLLEILLQMPSDGSLYSILNLPNHDFLSIKLNQLHKQGYVDLSESEDMHVTGAKLTESGSRLVSQNLNYKPGA